MSSAASRPQAVKIYVALVVAVGILALALSATIEVFSPLSTPNLLGVLIFVVVGLGFELGEHRLAFGSATGSMAFIIYLASAVAFGPVWCAIIAGTSLSVAHLVIGKPLIKIVFNAAQNVFALVAGSAAYVLAGGTTPPESLDRAVIPFFGLVVTYFVINSSAVSGVVALSEGRRFSEVWLRNTWSLAGYDMVASALALGIAWLFLKFGVLGMAAVVVPILFLRHTYMVNLRLQATNRELLDLIVKAIEARDPYTSGHSQRVAALAQAIAREMGLSFREVEQIETAALLHDVGKIYEDFAPLLRKADRLTPEEQRIMQSHPIRSAELVGTISNLRGYVEKCVRSHHEAYDGSGYPDGLAGDGIPMGARVVLVADTTDAMTTDRPYRFALTYERALQELTDRAGQQFDPQVVAAFKRSPVVRRLLQNSELSAAARPVLAETPPKSASRSPRPLRETTRQAGSLV